MSEDIPRQGGIRGLYHQMQRGVSRAAHAGQGKAVVQRSGGTKPEQGRVGLVPVVKDRCDRLVHHNITPILQSFPERL